MEQVLFWYALGANVLGFSVCAADKRRAKRRKWRISEQTLFVLAILGGSLGVLCAMYAFRHKTQKWYFKWGIPLILLVQAVLAGWLLWLLHTA